MPTVCVSHAPISTDPVHTIHIADHLLLYGDSSRCALLALGTDPSRLSVCGATFLDERATPSTEVHPAIRSRFGIDPGAPWALVATSGPGHSVSKDHHFAIIEAVMRLSAERTDLAFAVRLHRKDRAEYYRRVEERVPQSRLRYAENEDPDLPASILEWLAGCSVVLTGASTVALEAMLLDVAVVTVDLANELTGVDFIDAGATIHVTRPDEVGAAIDRAMTRPANLAARARGVLEDHFFALDGRAAERCADVVAEIALARAR